jgi:CheY-like chemotaxis protein
MTNADDGVLPEADRAFTSLGGFYDACQFLVLANCADNQTLRRLQEMPESAMRNKSIASTLRDVEMSKAPLISIVDDDPLAGDGIRELVEALGYNAVTFTSAEHFLQSDLIAETTCLITDLQMPGLNGLELQETLRSSGYQTPIILITAHPNEKLRTRALEAGAVGFLSKPFDEGSLIECLTVATKLRSSRAWRRTA